MFEVLRVLQQGLKALRYLHEVAKMTHRDVKPANMLITNAVNFHIKLCDFGLATEEPLNTSIQGTRYYWAPEIGNGRYSNSVDIWALGVVILRLITPLPEANDEYDISKWAKVSHFARFSSFRWNACQVLALGQSCLIFPGTPRSL